MTMNDYTTTTVDGAMGFARMHYDEPMNDRHQDDHNNDIDTQECPRCRCIAQNDDWQIPGYSTIIQCPVCKTYYDIT